MCDYKKAWEILRAQITVDSTKRSSVIHRRVLCELLRIMNELEKETDDTDIYATQQRVFKDMKDGA